MLTESELLSECEDCYGTGTIPGMTKSDGFMTTTTPERACEKCKGAGKTLTDTGKLIIEVIRVARKQNHPDVR